MNYLRFNHKQQSDNEGTFWPGYIEIPEENQNDDFEENLNTNFSSNPRVYTGLGLLLLVVLFFLKMKT